MAEYSYSRLSTFQNCPFQYKLKYIDRIKRDRQTVEQFLGSRVHDVLEKLYGDLKLRKLPSLEELLDLYRSEWDKQWNPDIQIVKKTMTAQNYLDIGAKCISDYYAHYHPFNHAKTLGIELAIRYPLSETHTLIGYIDRLDLRDDGVMEIHDYKTGNSLPRQEDLAKDKQLALYHLALQQEYPQASGFELIWHYLNFDQELKSARDNEQLEVLREDTLGLISQIESSTDFPLKESALCGWCDYQDLCPARKHKVKTSEMEANEFLEESGVKLVNLYALLDAKKSEIEEKLEKVKKGLAAYAQREGTDVIQGSDFKARVRVETKDSYPTKSKPGRGELEALLKESGVWNEVVDLNPWMLEKVVAQNKWDPELIEKIKRFAENKESVRVWLSKAGKY